MDLTLHMLTRAKAMKMGANFKAKGFRFDTLRFQCRGELKRASILTLHLSP